MPEAGGAYSKLSVWDRCVVVGQGRGGRKNRMRHGGRVKLVMGWTKERILFSVTIWLALAWLVVVFGSGTDLG